MASMFIQRGYRHLPVTSDGQLIGIVSRSDVLRAVNDFLACAG
ncbi:MAG: CBS domain-containing protein [Planctomycetaceae bacterium]